MSHYDNPHGPGCPWYDLAELTGAPNVKWCEETLCQWISEPANTWSNIAYFIAAFIFYKQLKKSDSFEVRFNAITIAGMGICSFIYHMSNTYITQVLDFIGMFVFCYWIILINLRRMQIIKKSTMINYLVALTLGSVFIFHLAYLQGIAVQATIGILAAVIGLTELLSAKKESPHRNPYKIFVISALSLIVAGTFSALDVSRIWCDPKHHILLQGHALWHLFSALGVYFAAVYFRERERRQLI